MIWITRGKMVCQEFSSKINVVSVFPELCTVLDRSEAWQ
jgi:hypothetical protein